MRMGVTKKLRIERREAERWDQLARQLGLSEDELVQRAMRMYERLRSEGAPAEELEPILHMPRRARAPLVDVDRDLGEQV